MVPEGFLNLKGLFWLYRPQISLMGGLTAIAGASVSGVYNLILMVEVGVLFYFIHALAHPINDYFDKDLDEYARPNAPIPSGLISPKQAKFISVINVILALIFIILIPLNYLSKILAVIGLFIAIAFSTPPFRATGHPFFSYVFVGSGKAVAFLAGWTALGEITMGSIPIFLTVSIFLLNPCVKLIADIIDIESDKKTTRETLPIKIGVRNSFYIFLLLGAISMCFYYLRFLVLELNYPALGIGLIIPILFSYGSFLFRREYGKILGREYLQIFMPTQILLPIGIILGSISL